MIEPDDAKRRGYAVGHEKGATAIMATRAADDTAGFLLPHLRPGMRLLDCGCGPGSITLGLARSVTPGEVVGIDIGESQVETARTRAREEGIPNAHFQTGNITSLPFDDGSFDAVFVNAVLCHVSDPRAVLGEMKRVLKPGGLLAARDTDFRKRLVGPEEPLVSQFYELVAGIMSRVGGDPHIGSRLPTLVHEAGFVELAISASFECRSTKGPQAIEDLVSLLRGQLGQGLLAMGMADSATIEAIIVAARAWVHHPDSYAAIPYVEVLARRP